LFRELLGISGIKPFECVGTNEEVVLAMYMYYNTLNSKEIPIVLRIFEKDILPQMNKSDFINLEKKLFNLYTDEDIIPETIKSKLLTYYKNN
jgi:hypothetical protein